MKKLTKTEMRKLARNIIKTNDAVWNAIFAVEEFSIDEVGLINQENIEELAKIMTTLKGGSERMADPELYGLYFQQFEAFGDKLQEYLDKYEKD